MCIRDRVVLWEQLEILEQIDDFFLVITEDKYKGWINLHQIVQMDSGIDLNFVLISERYVNFYAEPEIKSVIVRDGFCGIRIPFLSEKNGWIKTTFPDSVTGWVETCNLGNVKKPDSLEIINYAKTFIGIPYLWGGKTVKGFDCSGFVQFIHKMFSINLRRDAWMQFEDSNFVSRNPCGGKPGDLFFFSERGQKVTHVGFVMKPGIILHCQGMVKIESLNQKNQLFNEKLFKDFVEIRTFLN